MGIKLSPVDTLAMLFQSAGFPAPEREHYFAKPRRFRFDLAWPALKLAAEYEGGVLGRKGRHVRPVGYSNDCEKYAMAALLGWKVLRITRKLLDDGRASELIDLARPLLAREEGIAAA